MLVEGVNNDAVQRQSALMKSKYIVSSPCYLRSLFFKLFYRSSLTNEEKKKDKFSQFMGLHILLALKKFLLGLGKNFSPSFKTKALQL